MHHSWNDDPIDVSQNFLEWFALLRWLVMAARQNRTRFAVRRNAQRFYFSRDNPRSNPPVDAIVRGILRWRVAEFVSVISDPYVMSSEAERSLAIASWRSA